MSEKEHEHIVDDEAPIPIVEGEDEFPVEPAPPLDPYTPEPGPRAGEQQAFKVLRWAWAPIAIAILLIVIGIFR
jgi:hypothetical protein